MLENQKQVFALLLTDVLSYYGKDLTGFVLGVYWDSLKRYDIDAVKRAFGVHAQDPERGQFSPKPADIVRLLDGGTGDRSLVAWSKVEKAIRQVGGYESIVFDDAIIHAVIADMGGWIDLCAVSERELPFKSKEFQQRYRSFAMRRQIPAYQKQLTGKIEASEETHGISKTRPVLIGDTGKAALVFKRGGDASGVGITMLNGPVEQVFTGLLDSKKNDVA